MKKLTILGVIVCVGLLFVPAIVISAPAGPPEGLDVQIVGQPVEVTGDVNVANEPNVIIKNDTTNPVPVSVQPDGFHVHVSSVYRFAGYTVAQTTGSVGGLKRMNALCQAEYGDEARMCTTEEWMMSREISPTPLEYRAWLNPVITHYITYIYEATGERWFRIIDASGAIVEVQGEAGRSYPNCNQWMSASSSAPGTWLHEWEEGSMSVYMEIGRCNEEMQVVCCLPAQ